MDGERKYKRRTRDAVKEILFIFYGSSGFALKSEKMAGVMGLEPTAFAVTGRRCNQLNYTPA